LRAAKALALVAALAAGCGAKTGLFVPEVRSDGGRDAGVDASSDGGVPCIEIPLDGGPIDVPLDLAAELGRADVLFLVDTTASMGEEIEAIRDGLRDRIAPGIAAAIPDSALGVAHFDDFPEGMCGSPTDVPFRLIVPITQDLNRVQAAVDSLRLGNGLDRPESHVEGLYQVATGEGIGAYVEPSYGCPGGGLGYPCFRLDALPIVVLFTDAPFHAGPGGSSPYACAPSPAPHTYEEARDALESIGAKVIGMYSAEDGVGRADLVTLAEDTGAMDGDRPLVFDIGSRGQRLSEDVVRAVETLADVVRFDVDAYLVDPLPSDDLDPRTFVESLVPTRAEPMDRVEAIDADAGVFRGVHAGTRIYYELRVRNDAVVPGRWPRRVPIEVVFRGDRRARLGSRTLELVIPGADGSGCEAPLR
jgi:hypothetical protein